MPVHIAGDPGRLARPGGLKILLQGGRTIGRVLFSRMSDEAFFREALPVADLLLDIPARLRARGLHRLAGLGPALFASNHVGIFDPVYIIREILAATDYRLRPAQIMRDDFFKLAWINRAMARSCNNIPFPRGSLNRSRLAAVLQRIRGHLDRSVLLFVSGTRSRTGEILYLFQRQLPGRTPDDGKRPAGRFLELLLGGLGTPLRVVPTTITYDFASRAVHLVFGEPVAVAGDETPRALGALVRGVTDAIGKQVSVGPQHLLAAILRQPHLRAEGGGIPLIRLRDLLQGTARRLAAEYAFLQEGVEEDLDRAMDRSLAWYRARGALSIRGGCVTLRERDDAGAPSSGASLRGSRPVLFHWNQVRHLEPLRRALQETLAAPAPRKG